MLFAKISVYRGECLLKCLIFSFIFFRNLPMILNWVKAQKPGVMGVNIITSDFVELVDFAATVIALNDLLLEEDESTSKSWCVPLVLLSEHLWAMLNILSETYCNIDFKQSFVEELWLKNIHRRFSSLGGCVDLSGTHSTVWVLLHGFLWLHVWLSYAHICCSTECYLPANKRLASEADVPNYCTCLPGD